MKIDIWSDYVCPFCTLGARHLELALEQFESDEEIEIVWHSYQLDPDAPAEPTGSMVDHLVEKKGMPRAQVEQMTAGIAAKADEVGLTFNWQEGVSANTRDAHRIAHLAIDHGKGVEWDDAVKHAFFTDGRNIADHDTLRAIATDIGLDRGDVDRVLASSEYDEHVQQDIDAARSLGVQGVPFFVFDERLAVSGAQPVEVFTAALEQAAGIPQ